MFGNITGGGTISSKYDYNPTSYVPVVGGSLRASGRILPMLVVVPASDPYRVEATLHYGDFRRYLRTAA